MASNAGWSHTHDWALDDMGDVSKAGVPCGGLDRGVRSPPGTGKHRTILGPGGPSKRRPVPSGDHATERLAGWVGTGCGRAEYFCHQPPEVYGNGHKVKPREYDDYRRTIHPFATATRLSGSRQSHSTTRTDRGTGDRGFVAWNTLPETPRTARSQGVPTIFAEVTSPRGDGLSSSPFASPQQQRAAGQATKRLDRLNTTMPARLSAAEDTGSTSWAKWQPAKCAFDRLEDFKREGRFTNDAYFATARQSHEVGGPTGLRDMSHGSPNRVARVKKQASPS